MKQWQVKPFSAGDLEGFRPQKGQRPELPVNWPAVLLLAAQLGPTGSFRHKGRTVAVAGLLPDEWGVQAWALLDERAGSCLLPITRTLKWFLEHFKKQERPITVFLRRNWPQAAKWAGMLGFRPTGGLAGALALWVHEPGKD